MDKQYMTVEEAAVILSVSVHTVNRTVEKLWSELGIFTDSFGEYLLTKEDITWVKLSIQQSPPLGAPWPSYM